ncbi:MAG TPA: xylulokinase [Acidimicrobiales bacterium]|nr:xylulokinase [Acidimicrobiales bacterium]
MALVLGVDCSTQSTKVELRDSDTGALLASGRAAHPPTSPPRSEQDPDQWWKALAGAVSEAVGGRSLAESVSAVSVAGQQHGLVALDEQRAVLRPAKLWNDTEAAPDAGWLLTRMSGAEWAASTGSVPTAAFTVAKLSWLHRVEPERFERLAHVLLPHDWLTAMLTGRLVTDRGDASGTGYWSPSEGRWRTDLLEVVDASKPWADMLPAVLAPADQAGELQPGPARALGLPAGIPVAAGTGDNMAAALRLGLGPGDVAFSIGTSGTVYAVADRPTSDATGAVAGFADATGRFLPLVCTLNAAKVTDTVARLLGVDAATLSDTALAADAGAGGLVLVPYLDGERTPDRPSATGTLAGIRSDVTRPQLARAAFEGVVCGLLDGLDALAGAGVPVEGGRAVLIGGGARSAAYRRVLADLSGLVVDVPDELEHVAAGACVQAAACLAGVPPAEVSAAWGPGTGLSVEPDPAVDAGAVRAAYAAARG